MPLNYGDIQFLRNMTKRGFDELPEARSLQSINPSLALTSAVCVHKPAHRSRQEVNQGRLDNVNGVVPDVLPDNIRLDMLQNIRFRPSSKSAALWTWTKLRVLNNLGVPLPNQNGGQGTFHATHEEVCKAVWKMYDQRWRDYVLVN